MTLEILLTLFLVALNGFFVAAEFAIVKVRSTQLVSFSSTNKNLVASAQKVVSNLDAYLAATQLGITLASLGLGWVGEDVMTKIILQFFDWLNLNLSPNVAHKMAIPIAFAVITVLHIVFGELAPKSIAIRKPTSTTMFVTIPLRIFYFIFRPFIFLLNGFANFILRLIGIPPIKEQDIHTEEELKLIIAESEEGGAIEETERELIHNVFDFDDRRVKHVLVHRRNMIAIDANAPFDEIVSTVIEEGYSRYPVYQDSVYESIFGIIYTKDLLREIHVNNIKSIENIIRPVIFAPESMKIKDLLKILQNKHQQIAIITNEYGGTSGLVTMEDILEELVGEIQDEYDVEQPIVRQNADDTFIIDAQSYMGEINKYLPYPLPESEKYETLSGLISYQSNDIPVEGETIIVDNYELKVLEVHKSSATKVLLKLVDKNAGNSDNSN